MPVCACIVSMSDDDARSYMRISPLLVPRATYEKKCEHPQEYRLWEQEADIAIARQECTADSIPAIYCSYTSIGLYVPDFKRS